MLAGARDSRLGVSATRAPAFSKWPIRIISLLLAAILLLGSMPCWSLGEDKAYAFAPAIAVPAATIAAELGISEVALMTGIAALLGAGLGIAVDTSGIAESIDANGGIDLEEYNTHYQKWKDMGVDIPQWNELPTNEQLDWGWAWKYDQAVWLGLLSKWGINWDPDDPDPNNNNRNNKAWNAIKALGKSGAAISAAVLGGVVGAEMGKKYFGPNDGSAGSGVGMSLINKATVDGKELPMMLFYTPDYYVDVISGNNTYQEIRDGFDADQWMIWGYVEIYNGISVMRQQFYFMYDTYKANTPLDLVLSNNKWTYNIPFRINNANFRQGSGLYSVEDGTWEQGGYGVVAESGSVGTFTTYDGGTISRYYTIGINPLYRGGWNLKSGGNTVGTIDSSGVTGVDLVNNIQYGQLADYPSELAESVGFSDPQSFQDGWDNLAENVPEGYTGTISNPFYEGNYQPVWQDYYQTTPSKQVQPVPDTQPGTEPLPEPEEQPSTETEPDYSERLNNIADLVFEQLFPFCLINDIKRISDKVVLAGSTQADFSIDLPLTAFGIDGVNTLRLDANHPNTGGGLIEIGNYTRPMFNFVLIAVLLGLSIKLFLR